MSDFRELYQEVIIDHSKRPRNYHPIADADSVVEGYNPLCGDRFTVYLKLKDGVIDDLAFEGHGCAISTASASLMTEGLKGKSAAEAEELFDAFHKVIVGEAGDDDPRAQRLGKLKVLAGVRDYPTRVKCATLAWHTLRSALHGEKAPVSTE